MSPLFTPAEVDEEVRKALEDQREIDAENCGPTKHHFEAIVARGGDYGFGAAEAAVLYCRNCGEQRRLRLPFEKEIK